MNFRYLLSELVPVPMASNYIVLSISDEGEVCRVREHATWWQWRGHAFHRRRHSTPFSTAT